MTLDELSAELDSRGADLGRWPETLRLEAERLIDAVPEARALVEREARFDALFVPAIVPPPPDLYALVGAITARPVARSWFGVMQATAVLGCLLLGFGLGTLDRAHQPTTVAEEVDYGDLGAAEVVDE